MQNLRAPGTGGWAADTIREELGCAIFVDIEAILQTYADLQRIEVYS